MKKILISEDVILAAARDIIAREGIDGLSIRTLARNCDISVGTIYNYFPSKHDLMTATFTSIWGEILPNPETTLSSRPFPEAVQVLFESLQVGCRNYPCFVQGHALSFGGMVKGKAREGMVQYFGCIRAGLLDSLARDIRIRKEVFTEQFTPDDLVGFVFFNLVSLIIRNISSCDFLLEVIHRIVY